MTFREKKEALKRIYERFEQDASEFKKDAICKIGCTFCCTDVGNVDTTTLEGVIIREPIERLPERLRRTVTKKVRQNRLEKENKKIARCPFLKEDDTCLIYDIRPFSCRQLYSIRECRGRGPTVHRQARELAKQAVSEMQRLDDTGYSGHLSFILHLLDLPGFKKLYLSGGFDPGRVAEFGKDHGLIINRFAK
ncbi:MAG: YkgJ family cysteine cluster protein [Deltaproteobacteria bacterium]|nr:YkgJ family cysteine cluster protein [Deltaproteobacteria bacterium]